MQRFFVPPDAGLVPGADLALPATIAHQAGRVLRLRPGAHILLLDNSGDEYEVELHTFARSGVQGRVLARRPAPCEGGLQVTLYQCLLKGEKFGWVLQKATELGVYAVVPVVSERTVAAGAAGDAGKPARWPKIVREAAEQCRRGRLPEVAPPLPWAAALAAASGAGPTLVPWEEAPPGGSLRDAVRRARQAGRVSLFVGPEGGLTAAEVAAATARGAQALSLGPRILRAETAALAALALLLLPD